ELFPPALPPPPGYGEGPLPRSLKLPRKGVREVVARRPKLEYETYPQSEQGEGLLPGSEPAPNRWFIGFGRWKRYADPSTETTYPSVSIFSKARPPSSRSIGRCAFSPFTIITTSTWRREMSLIRIRKTGRLAKRNSIRCRRRSPKFICAICRTTTISFPCAPAFNRS